MIKENRRGRTEIRKLTPMTVQIEKLNNAATQIEKVRESAHARKNFKLSHPRKLTAFARHTPILKSLST